MGMLMEWPMKIWADNDQAVVFQKGTCVNSKLKGTFDMRLKWIGELKADNVVQGAKVDRENNLSDILTHCQPGEWKVYASSDTNPTTLQKVLRTEKLSKYRETPGVIKNSESTWKSPIQELIKEDRGGGQERTSTNINLV